MNQIEKWLRSKTGRNTLIGVVVLLLAVGVVGQLVGWWDIVGLSSTAGLPSGEWPAPADGVTCLPTCVETDGRFLLIANAGIATFAGEKVVLWVSVPGNQADFTLGIFDGDAGKNAEGVSDPYTGHWDSMTTEATYTLYADPLKNGAGTSVVASWTGNGNNMPDNAWYEATVQNVSTAKSPSGHYFYRLEVTQGSVDEAGFNSFKIRSSGYVSTGRANYGGGALGLVATSYWYPDYQILFPRMTSLSRLGPSNYNGQWKLYFYVPNGTTTLEFWDGDFDRGNATNQTGDTDDPNTTGKPEWASSYVVDERAGGQGNPQDDNSYKLYRIGPAVQYTLIDPEGSPIYTNPEPSGTEEWEHFVISTDPSVAADLSATSILPGFYTWHITGLDYMNAVYLRTNYEILPYCGDGPCKPPEEWLEAACPRTIGYWKNNVKKVLMQGKTRGVQESRETLEWGLNNVALASPLFRSGLNVNAPAPIGAAVRLTDAEANAILQKTGNGNSMLARALQQNLAAWLNLGTGKIGPKTVIHLSMSSGTFDGTMWDALQTAQNIILYERDNAARLEYAKDIADMINNNQLNADPDDVLACQAYTDIIPPTSQPPPYEDLPEGPKPPDEPEPTVVPPTDSCDVPDWSIAGDFAIIALNPADCQGEQNGLLFHGTSLTQIDGTAYSFGCVRAVGTTDVQVTAPVQYVSDQFGDMTLISQGVQQVPAMAPIEIAAPDCSDPAAVQMDGKDFKGNMVLAPGLYCVSGDANINNNDTVIGNGVTLYFIDGKFTINGGATVQLSAPSEGATPALPGVLIYQPQSNANDLKINGNSDSYFSGVIYAPASHVSVLGTGFVYGYQAQIIGWDVEVGGTADVILDWRSNGAGVCP